MMLTSLRNPLPGIENAGDLAVDRIKQAATSAAEATKNATSQMEGWAKTGYGSARNAVAAKPLLVGASLGFGALVGGLYALWQRGAAKQRRVRKAVPVRARAKQSVRAMSHTNGTGSAPKRKAKRTARAAPSLDS